MYHALLQKTDYRDKRRGHDCRLVYAWSFIHYLYFIYARKLYVRSHGKITRQWKSTLNDKIEEIIRTNTQTN